MNYNAVYDIIAMHANDLLPLFADNWERWPDESVAEKLVGDLKKKAQSDPNRASKLISAANAIITGSKLSFPPISVTPQGLGKLASMLDSIAERLEKKGLTREAYELDKVADKLEAHTHSVPPSTLPVKIRDILSPMKISSAQVHTEGSLIAFVEVGVTRSPFTMEGLQAVELKNLLAGGLMYLSAQGDNAYTFAFPLSPKEVGALLGEKGPDPRGI